MTDGANRSDTAFTGRIPEMYDHLMGPMVFAPYAAGLARRVSEIGAGRILETAAGTGMVTRALLGSLPESVEIVATDLNPAMLAYAASRTNDPRVQWRQAD